MAVGFSGSNGGIIENQKRIPASDLQYETFIRKYPYPIEISYFINNSCNLGCKHCYVAYEEDKYSLSVEQWKIAFDELISMGALTFGNVGKEPVLAWNETRELMLYFKEKKQSIPKLRFGFVTNATMLDRSKIEELERIQPDYIDISLDGTKDTHDYIRGSGNYDRTMKNLKLMSEYEVIEKVFISFTANKFNIATIGRLVDSLYNMGVKKMLISPYITRDKFDSLYLPDEGIIKWVEELLAGNVIDFTKYQGLNIYIKNDYSTTLNLMERLVNRGIIDKNNLLVDDYGVIFNKYTFYGNDLYFNYLPWDDFFVRAIRFSHDGYVSNCFDMFFSEYPERAIGNVREKSIREILQYDIPLLKAAI
ncbi:MAG: radical SAM protein [Deltaproteobacteria bacterium]|nr:radical SAM protein [Deltaproteobacteria bacterium]